MRLIPPFPNQETPSDAEVRLFQEFQRVNLPDIVVMHSLNLPEHMYKAMGELDFVLIGRRGLLVLEVKGGGVSCNNGIWVTTDRWRKTHRLKESPFDQASTGMWSLTRRMYDAGLPREINNLTPGFGVVFPDITFQIQGEEWDLETVLDKDRWEKEGVAGYLRNLLDYWHRKFSGKPEAISQDTLNEIIRYLRPDFEQIPSIEVEAERIEKRLVRLTGEQYSRLDIIEHAPRILVQGGAGTGKTFLALEMARRHAKAGEHVLLLCFSPVLAEYLKHQVEDKNIKIHSVHGEMLSLLKENAQTPNGYFPGMPVTSPWFTEQLAPAFEYVARGLEEEKKYDVLIIDEGQDILNLKYLIGIENLLRGGFEKGIWRIFYDPFHQGAIYNAMDPETVKMLSGYGTVTPRLTVNCRNTDPIILQTRLATGEEIATESTGPGPDVVIRFYRDRIDQARLLQEFLEGLLEQDVAPGEITILSSLPFTQSGISMLTGSLRSKIRVVNGNAEERFPGNDITFCTVAEFKGLENRFIAFIDIDKLDTPGDLDTLYVGMTRPRVRLMLGIDIKLQGQWDRITGENLKKIYGRENYE